jgi:hypothetical protein
MKLVTKKKGKEEEDIGCDYNIMSKGMGGEASYLLLVDLKLFFWFMSFIHSVVCLTTGL